MRKTLFFFSAALSAFLLSSACGKEAAEVRVTKISLSETQLTLRRGDVRSLSATVVPSSATNTAVVWSSSNSNVATVRDGLVTAVEIGSAQIYVSSADGRKRASCTVTVIAEYIAVEEVLILDEEEDKVISGTVLNLTEGDTYQAISGIRPGDATNQNVSWVSSDPTVVSVKDGLLKAGTPGTATVTVTSDAGALTASLTVKVSAYVPPVDVTGVTLSKTSLTLSAPGQTATLTATVKPDDATNKSVRWSSSDEGIVTVSAEGLVTGIAPGQATITVRTVDQGKTATCTVDVKGYVESVSLDRSSASLSIGATLTLTATVLPSGAIDKAVSWSSSDPTVVSVDENGTLTALASGIATVTVTTRDRGLTAACQVIVTSGSTGDISGGNETFDENPFNW